MTPSPAGSVVGVRLWGSRPRRREDDVASHGWSCTKHRHLERPVVRLWRPHRGHCRVAGCFLCRGRRMAWLSARTSIENRTIPSTTPAEAARYHMDCVGDLGACKTRGAILVIRLTAPVLCAMWYPRVFRFASATCTSPAKGRRSAVDIGIALTKRQLRSGAPHKVGRLAPSWWSENPLKSALPQVNR